MTPQTELAAAKDAVCAAAVKFIDTLAAGCSERAAERRVQALTTAVFRLASAEHAIETGASV